MKDAPVFSGFWEFARCVVCKKPGCILISWRPSGRPIHWCSSDCYEKKEADTGKIKIIMEKKE